MKFLYKYPQSGISLLPAGRGESPPRQDATWNTNCSTPASSTKTATSTSSSSTPRPARKICLIRIQAINRGPDAAALHLLPTLWFRNTWSWGLDARTTPTHAWQRPTKSPRSKLDHDYYGARWLYCEGTPELLFTENETNRQPALWRRQSYALCQRRHQRLHRARRARRR